VRTLEDDHLSTAGERGLPAGVVDDVVDAA